MSDVLQTAEAGGLRRLLAQILLQELDDDQRRQGYPWEFYGLTDEGREFLKEHNLLAAEETLQQIYETISEKPEKMIKYENAPRPDGVYRFALFVNSVLSLNPAN